MREQRVHEEAVRIRQGNSNARDKLRREGKLFVREHLTLLLDTGTELQEDCLFARCQERDIPADGVVTGIGTVLGRPVCVMANDLHLIMYTSGTTGPSKGVMSPHSQGHAVGYYVARHYGYLPDDVLYSCLPLFHANALWYSAYAALWADAALALASWFSASEFWDDIRRTRATQFNSLGAMTNIMWKIPPSVQDREHRLRQCMVVPVPKEIYREIQERYGLTLTSPYAMTETFPVTMFMPEDPPEKAGAAGRTRGYAEVQMRYRSWMTPTVRCPPAT